MSTLMILGLSCLGALAMYDYVQLRLDGDSLFFKSTRIALGCWIGFFGVGLSVLVGTW